MFRIERNLVNLAASRSVQIGSEIATEIGAAGDAPAASALADFEAREIMGRVEEEAAGRAEKILYEARSEASAILFGAREEAEEIRMRAFQDACLEGREEGKRFFDEKLAEKMREDDQMLKRVIHEIYDERERTYSGLEDEVVSLAVDIVRKVIGPAEEELGGVFLSLVRNALRQIAPDGKVMIRVSPLEYERFFSSGNAAIELDKGVSMTVSVLRDVSLNEGDCIIDTDDETINAGLDSQLKYVKLAFQKCRA